MPIVFKCGECGESFEVDESLAGKAIRCRECDQYGKVPLPEIMRPRPPAPLPAPPPPPVLPQPVSRKVPGEPWYFRAFEWLAWAFAVLAEIGFLRDFFRRHEVSRELGRSEDDAILWWLIYTAVLAFFLTACLVFLDVARSLRKLREK
jgi:hypothetical protein